MGTPTKRRVPVSVERGYELWAERYDDYPNGLVRIEEPRVRALLGDVRGLRVLDAGCGTGRHTAYLHAEGAKVVAIDPSEAMLSVARRKCPGVELRKMALEHVDFAAGSFDAVICALVMEHLPDVRPVLGELVRVLAPSGSLVVSVYHPWMLMRGVPPHFESPDDDCEFELPSFIHLPSTYVTELLRLGMELSAFEEPIVDEELVGALPRMAKHHGHPFALVLRARKPPTRRS